MNLAYEFLAVVGAKKMMAMAGNKRGNSTFGIRLCRVAPLLWLRRLLSLRSRPTLVIRSRIGMADRCAEVLCVRKCWPRGAQILQFVCLVPGEFAYRDIA